MSDRQVLKDALVGVLGSKPSAEMSSARDVVNLANSVAVSGKYADAATAGTAITETVHWRAPYDCKVISAYVSAPVAAAAHASNIATFTVAKRTGAGGATTVASGSTVTGGAPAALAAFVPGALTMSTVAGATTLTAGDVLTFAVAKGASGVALTAATSYLDLTVLVEAI